MQPERSLSHTPLFQVIFALENTPEALDHKGLALRWLEVDRGRPELNSSLFISDKGRELSAIWEYSSDLFDGEKVSQMMSSYKALLESILDHPEEQIGYLQIWSEGIACNCSRSHIQSRFNTPLQCACTSYLKLKPS